MNIDFSDGDTRLDPMALMVGSLASQSARTPEGTVIMAAAASPPPVVMAVHPYGPYAAAALTPRRHATSARSSARLTTGDIIVAGLGVMTLVTAFAVLWAHFY